MSAVDEVLGLFAGALATARYSEAVTQTEHALQCAALAVAAGADDALVAAALLHDVGHLLTVRDRAAGHRPSDDRRHEAVGAVHLATWFGPEVTRPVALHVAAKRYLCAVDDGYAATLSPASVHSLALQGGPMTAEQCEAFAASAGAEAAVALRRWDDLAKVPGLAVALLEEYAPLLAGLAAPARRH
ncbi:MAG: HD domain-containing protein [Acidimicrobiales bacterium]